jgi:hypothetical protein
MAKEEKLKGVGGWLLFFIITLVFITPLSTLYYLSSDYFIIDGLFDTGLALISIGFAVWAVVAGISLWRKKPEAVIRTKEFLITYLAFAVVSLIIGIIFTSDLLADDIFIEDSVNLVRSLVYFGIWFSYLNMSKRVKNTFKKRDLNVKRLIITILITLGVAFVLIFLFSPYYFETETIPVDIAPITETLTPGYLQYHEFSDQYSIQDISLNFESTGGAVEIYMVRSETEFDKFARGEDIDVYSGCFKKTQYSGVIDCEIQGGGIIVYNPNNWDVTYTLKLN